MTSTSITAPGLSGLLQMTWLQDDLAHVLEHADVDEPSGTWTGLACRDHELTLGGDVDNAKLRRLATNGKIADLVCFFNEKADIELDGELQERPDTPWSRKVKSEAAKASPAQSRA